MLQIRRNVVGSLVLAVIMTCVAALLPSVGGSSNGPGEAKLIAFEPIAEMSQSCEWEVADLEQTPFPGLAGRLPYAQQSATNAVFNPGRDPRAAAVADRDPLRFIQDPYPSFSNVRIDYERNEVIALDGNRFRIMVYDRTANTPATATHTEPKRVIGGEKTRSQYASDLYVDPKTHEIYAVNNDSLVGMNVFGLDKVGDVAPTRALVTPYGGHGMAVKEATNDLFITVQHDGAIAVWDKSATRRDLPKRLIQGPATQLADPHGIHYDAKENLLYVVNFGLERISRQSTTVGRQGQPGPRDRNWPAGNYSFYRHEVVNGSGKFGAPSITVYRADAEGDVAPLRVIKGPRTQMNWPTGISVDSERGEIYIANDIGDTITVYSANATGDVAPIRVIKGPKTQLRYPIGVLVDPVHRELWVSNYGNHRITVYPLTASGDAAPIRVIRGAAEKEPSTSMSNPFVLAYDPTREQVLVPNCVGHPRLAAFARTADKNAEPVRAIQGTNTLLSRTVHGVEFDEMHDEIFVNADIPQAVLVYRGGANGDEKPIRILYGDKTGFRDPEKLGLDPVNNELYVINKTQNDRILVFDRTAQGNVAPKRVLMGPDTMLGASHVQVDTINDLLVVAGNVPGQGTRILIFPRTASGNAKPLRVIGGPNSQLYGVSAGFRLYPPTGKILANVRGQGHAFTGVWSIHDKGDVQPQWTIARDMLKEPRGLTVDAKNKVVMISDKNLQGVLSYSLPEMFEQSPRETARLGQ